MAIPLTLTPSNTMGFSAGLSGALPGGAGNAPYLTLPAPWTPVSPDPGIRFTVTNYSASAPIAPILLDVWTNPVNSTTTTYTFAELSTVQPGQSITETVAGIPVTTMRLALWYLGIEAADIAAGWTVNVQAWAV